MFLLQCLPSIFLFIISTTNYLWLWRLWDNSSKLERNFLLKPPLFIFYFKINEGDVAMICKENLGLFIVKPNYIAILFTILKQFKTRSCWLLILKLSQNRVEGYFEIVQPYFERLYKIIKTFFKRLHKSCIDIVVAVKWKANVKWSISFIWSRLLIEKWLASFKVDFLWKND